MKTRETFPGKWYAVTSASGCTVTFETKGDTVTLEMKAPQDVFCAVGSKVTISDDSATLTQTFNLAPSFFKAARGWGQDPIWFQSLHAVLTRLLDGTQFEMVLTEQGSKLIVHTDRVADDLLEQVRTTAEAYLPAGVELVQYNHHIEVSWRDIPPGIPSDWINKYDKCVTKADLVSVDNRWKYDTLTISGVKDWFSKRYPECYNDWIDNRIYLHTFSKLTYAEFEDFGSTNITWVWCPELTYMDYSWFGYTSALFSYFYAPKSTLIQLNGSVGFDGCFSSAKDVVYQSGDIGNKETECYAEFPSLSKGVFITSWAKVKFSKKSVLRILGSIPSYSSGNHTLSIGIHINHQYDGEVLAAISNAEAKGWTLTVQWNGTPTATTASTFGMGSLIFAKVGEMERPDGTTEKFLDWGHYVTDETGYETFRSLESAYEYFGLPMPEEESQPTE